MKNIVMAFRSLFKKGRSNGIKILSLGVGLAMGLILISKVIFEFTYDDFFPDKERIYRVMSNYTMGDGSEGEYWNLSGGVAPGMKREIPEVEIATRYTSFGDMVFKTPDKNKYKGRFIFADTCFFDVLPLPVLAGDVKEVLSRPMYAMVSEKIAKNMGGIENAIGKVFEIDPAPGRPITIGGVFKDLPENTHLNYDIMVSMVSIGRFSHDGTENWVGNDRYTGFVKLYPGVEPESLYPAFRQMQERNMPMEELKKAGVDVHYTLVPLTDIHSKDLETRRMALLLGLLAFALIFTAIMNYILIVLSSLVTRTKEMAVYKSYGASGKNIMDLMMTETALHLFFALLLSVFLIFLFRSKVYEILNVTVDALFSGSTIVIITGICLIVFLVSGVVPSMLYARIPVASAFRNFKESRRNWKLASLFIQFIATMFLVSLLVIIWKQYRLMINDDPGYTYEKVIYCSTSGIQPEERQKALDELRRLSFVESIATASTLPMDGFSGNNVSLPGEDRELFNMADMYYADENYFSLLDIPVIEGRGFDPTFYSEDNQQALVSRTFAEKVSLTAGWSDGIVGKSLDISEHGTVTVCGVFPDIRLGSIAHEDKRPTAIFYGKSPNNLYLVVKLQEFSSENMMAVSRVLERLLPDKDIEVHSYKMGMVDMYGASRLFRDSVMIGGIVTLLISLIGLIGYLKDEMNRRRSEIAVRRINGGTVADILLLFIKDIFRIAFPAVLFGGIIAYVTGMKWLESFSVKSHLSFFIFLICGIIVLTIIIALISLNGYKNASENPVHNLRSE